MRTPIFLLTAALVSCQPGSDATVDPNSPDTMKPDNKPPIKIVPNGFENKSGTRIKVNYTVFRSSDGLAAAYNPNLYDSQLGTQCSRQVAADGKFRCLPSPMANSQPSYGEPSWYTDSSCSNPVFRVQPKDCGTGFGNLKFGGIQQEIDGCTGTSVFELGNKVEPLSIYVKEPGRCRKITADESAQNGGGWWLHFEIKRRLAPSDFVELTTETVAQ